jgi:hypothetical protein
MKYPLYRSIIILVILFGLGWLLSACAVAQAVESEVEQLWQTSAHADAEARAFTNWNRGPDETDEDQPAVIPKACAKCHSTTGYHDYLGLDGSTAGEVDNAAPVGTTIECEVCHNDVTKDKHSSVMPSGAEITGLGKENVCLDCHQGRQSTVSVNEATAGLDEDEINEELSFLNIHNNAAGATQHGTEAQGGYEYEGRKYSGLYTHVTDFETCIACHNQHTLQVDARKCRACHVEAVDTANLRNIRVRRVDYDGDGDNSEGIADEIETIRERLLLAIRIYAARTEGLDNIVYEDRNPYFFDEDGEPYATWTPRLLRAAYNYQYAVKGVGGYAHNSQYTIQLLYDSLYDLGAGSPAMTRPRTTN